MHSQGHSLITIHVNINIKSKIPKYLKTQKSIHKKSKSPKRLRLKRKNNPKTQKTRNPKLKNHKNQNQNCSEPLLALTKLG